MITISKVGSATIRFEFTDNDHYLQNGVIDVPVNSLSLVRDGSEMVTFLKAYSNDRFISAKYSELGMTPSEMEEFYEQNMVRPMGGGESSISEIYIGTSADTVDPTTGVVTKYDGKKEWLNIVYKDINEVYSMTMIDMKEFILENEFESGVTVNDSGVVHGVVDEDSEKIFISYDLSGNPSSSASVLTVGESGFSVNNIQTAIDEKAKATVKKIGEKVEYVWDDTRNKMVLNIYDEDDNVVNSVDFFDTDDDGCILLPRGEF